jgi:coenzyme PQQ precursor peptide PqqA
LPCAALNLQEFKAPTGSDILVEIMEWTAPAFEEVCLNCEINSYASAAL